MIHHRRAPQTGDFLRQARRRQPGKFRHRFEVDVERIEKKPAVGRIRACPLGLVGKECVQWIEPDSGGAEIGRKLE